MLKEPIHLAHSRSKPKDCWDEFQTVFKSVHLTPVWDEDFFLFSPTVTDRAYLWAMDNFVAQVRGLRLENCLHGMYLTGCANCHMGLDHASWWYSLLDPNTVYLISHEYDSSTDHLNKLAGYAKGYDVPMYVGSKEQSWYGPGSTVPVTFVWTSPVYASPLTAAIDASCNLSDLEEQHNKYLDENDDTDEISGREPWRQPLWYHGEYQP